MKLATYQLEFRHSFWFNQHCLKGISVKMKLRYFLAAVWILVLPNAPAATFEVTATSDSGPGSLRQAILDANSMSGDDIISFTVTGTITLASALPLITDSTKISGPGTNLLTISGDNSVNVFTFSSGTTNTISGLTIADGMANNYVNGAGIANMGNLTILNCALLNNRNFSGWGGAVFNSGELSITNSLFSGNSARFSGLHVEVIGDRGQKIPLDFSTLFWFHRLG